ncbi:MAG TPA: PepSY domain-containing protein [Chthonomonadaceae bacterium]|nr:PepSY domain-containing protein [Chthonomonadaceae bacterium]
MMQTKRTLSVLGIGLGLAALAGGLSLVAARAQEGKKAIPTPTGKITPWQAIKIATTKVPGQALNANFEFDEGHWVYGVMVVSGKKIHEIEIDPNTGKVGDVEEVTPEGEGKEVTAELNAALGVKSDKSDKEKEGK